MPFNAPPGNGPVQGLAAARPQAGPPQGPPGAGGGPQDPKVLLQAAAGLLKQAVSQFGPEIIQVLKQILDGAGGGAPPQGPGGGGNGPVAPQVRM